VGAPCSTDQACVQALVAFAQCACNAQKNSDAAALKACEDTFSQSSAAAAAAFDCEKQKCGSKCGF
jgi:hypothetical protein